MKKIVLTILTCALLVSGCSTTPAREKESNPEVTVWERAELEEHIGGYLKKYGDPIIYMYAYNYETGQEYLEVYWNVKGRKLKVVLYKEDFVWDVMEDQIARSRL